jgi:hypothetical protein
MWRNGGIEMELSEKQAEDLIKNLAHIRIRPSVWIDDVTYKSFRNWWSGYVTACRLFDVYITELVEKIYLKRGWKDSIVGPIPSMRNRGLSEEEIVVEYLTIIIQAIQMKTGIGNKPILEVHHELCQQPRSEFFLELINKIEADMQRNYDE